MTLIQLLDGSFSSQVRKAKSARPRPQEVGCARLRGVLFDVHVLGAKKQHHLNHVKELVAIP